MAMRKPILLCTALIAFWGTAAASGEGFVPGGGPGPKILIAYFSRAGENSAVGRIEKGNTEIVAEMIAERTGGQLFRIETKTPYPEGFAECAAAAKREKDARARPGLRAKVGDIWRYDVIFLGYPIWWGDMPMAVYSFLEGHRFRRAQIVSSPHEPGAPSTRPHRSVRPAAIIPFCTHEGSGLANTVAEIARVCPKIEVLGGLAVRGAAAQSNPDEVAGQVGDWISELDLLQYERGEDAVNRSPFWFSITF